jgi:hypothetical protein
MRFKSGSIPAADYMKFFGIKEFKTAAGKPVPWASWVLLDVPDGIDVKSERFRLWVSGALVGSPGLGNPDPDAFGVIIH